MRGQTFTPDFAISGLALSKEDYQGFDRINMRARPSEDPHVSKKEAASRVPQLR
jgi:hypothetical protein